MTPSSTSEARKRRDAKATPKPAALAEGVILTTIEAVLEAGHGQVALANVVPRTWLDWNDHRTSVMVGALILWRPTPERTFTVELSERTVRTVADDQDRHSPSWDRVRDACRAALDGDQ